MTAMVWDGHQSLKHNAPRAQRAAALETLTERASVGGLTEARGSSGLVPDGHGFWSGRGECGVVYARDTWKAWDRLNVCFSDRSWRVGPQHERTGVWGTFLLLEHGTGFGYLRGALHVPSSIQGGAGWSEKPEDRDNVRVAQDVLANIGPMIADLQRMLGPDESTISLDGNANVGLPAWRRRFNDALAPTGMRLHHTDKGTHRGGRTIDFHATTMRPAVDSHGRPFPVALLPDLPGPDEIDHSGVLAALTRRST